VFDVGKLYRLYFWQEDRRAELYNCRVVSVEMPLVKFDHRGDELIVNVGSKGFVKAEPESGSN
jgi:hypothetical protein